MQHVFGDQKLESYLSLNEYNDFIETLTDEDDKRILSKLYTKTEKSQNEDKRTKNVCCKLFAPKIDKKEAWGYSLKSKYDLKNLIGLELLKKISEVVKELYDEEILSVKQKDYYLNSG